MLNTQKIAILLEASGTVAFHAKHGLQLTDKDTQRLLRATTDKNMNTTVSMKTVHQINKAACV